MGVFLASPVKAWSERAVFEGGEGAKQQAQEVQLVHPTRQLLVLWHQLPVVLEEVMQAGPPLLTVKGAASGAKPVKGAARHAQQHKVCDSRGGWRHTGSR